MPAYMGHFQQKIIAIRADYRYEFELLRAPDCALDHPICVCGRSGGVRMNVGMGTSAELVVD
jgi:hypothetical protein